MVGFSSSPISKSMSLCRLQSPSQVTARKLIRKYSLGSSRYINQRKELTTLRSSLPNVRAAKSDFEVVMAAIKYIESLQHQVVFLNTKKGDEVPGKEHLQAKEHLNHNEHLHHREDEEITLDNESSQEEEKVEKNNN